MQVNNLAVSNAYPPREQALVVGILKQPSFKQLFKLPVIAWQELAIVIGAYAAVIASIALSSHGQLPYAVHLMVVSIAVYAAFTPLHDATHRSVSSNPWLNDFIGTVSAQLLLPGSTVSLYRILHLEHHRYTGDPERDPDEAMVSAPLWRRPLTLAFIDAYWAVWYVKNRQLRSGKQHVSAAATLLISITWHVAWLLSPFALEFFLLFMLPQRLGMLTVAYLFASIQHPEGVLENEQPFQATRLFRGGWFAHILMISQSQHLMHHLFPKIPYYRYDRAWKLSKPLLSAESLVWDWPVGKRAMPSDAYQQQSPNLAVEITAIERVAGGIKSFTFRGLDGPLPAFKPGAHIDVYLPTANTQISNTSNQPLVRQYSLTGIASEGEYSIAVKKEPAGGGGSLRMHQLQVGDQLSIGKPRNLFSLQVNDSSAILVAGGIGITPLLSMAQALDARKVPFEFHVCLGAQYGECEAELPFANWLAQQRWSQQLRYWLGNSKFNVASLPKYREGVSLYLCGPTGFMDYITGIAHNNGWPDSAIFTERFSAVTAADKTNRPFTVKLKKSAKTITVASDQSLLDALQAEKITIEGSCLQGICGTCRCQVLAGEVEHRDQFLAAEERVVGIMTACVSRAKGESLQLDL